MQETYTSTITYQEAPDKPLTAKRVAMFFGMYGGDGWAYFQRKRIAERIPDGEHAQIVATVDKYTASLPDNQQGAFMDAVEYGNIRPTNYDRYTGDGNYRQRKAHQLANRLLFDLAGVFDQADIKNDKGEQFTTYLGAYRGLVELPDGRTAYIE